MFRLPKVKGCLLDKTVTCYCLMRTHIPCQYLSKCISTVQISKNAVKAENKAYLGYTKLSQYQNNIFTSQSHQAYKNYTTEGPGDLGVIPEENDSEYCVFYRFPHIVLFRTISRLKLYQTGFLFLACPTAYTLAYLNVLPIASAHFSAGLATLAGVILYLMSGYMRKWIGIMALNEKNNTVRVSHLTFWGRRNDVLIPIENVIPISDLPDKPNDVFIKFRRYDSENDLYLSIRFGKIIDMDKFVSVMGTIR